MLLLLNLIAQASGPDVSGGAIAGWSSFGLSGAILSWLFLKYLPSKDAQAEKQSAAKDKIIRELNEDHKEAVRAVVENCKEEARLDRDASERRHKEAIELGERRHREAMELQGRIYEMGREGVHATRNLGHTIGARTFLADALQSAEIPTWTKALDGTLMSWNTAAERLLGWKQGEVVGKSVYETVIPPEKKDEEESVLARIGAGKTVEAYETTRMTRDRRRMILLAVTSPIRNQAGQIVGASTIARQPDH